MHLSITKHSFLLIIACIALAIGCKSKQKAYVGTNPAIDTTVAKTGVDKELIEDKPADSLLKVIRQKELSFKTLTAKVDVDGELDKNNASFNCNLRVVKDSAIWISISPALGIEVARILITTDSVKFINRINKKYFKGDFKYVNDMLQLDADFSMVQAILLGNTYLYYSEKNYLTSVDDKAYLISTLPKRKLKKAVAEEENPWLLVHANWIDPASFMVNKLFIKDFKANRKLEVNYTNLVNVDGQPVPHNVDIDIKAEKPAKIKLVYTKVQLNKPVVTPLTIPDSYERMQ
jgi:Domain of unknown function (DUF4292)